MKAKILITAAILGLVFGFLHPVFSATGASYIEAVNVKQAQGALSVSVKCSKSVDYKVINMSDPYRCLILEISPAQLTKQARITAEVNRGLIKGVRVGQFSDNPDIVRVVVDLNGAAQYRVYTNRGGADISLDVNYDKSPLAAQVSLNVQKTDVLDKINKITFLKDDKTAKPAATTPAPVATATTTATTTAPAPKTAVPVTAMPSTPVVSTPPVAVKPAATTPAPIVATTTTTTSPAPKATAPVTVAPSTQPQTLPNNKNTVKETVQKNVKPQSDLKPTSLKKEVEVNKDLPVIKNPDTNVLGVQNTTSAPVYSGSKKYTAGVGTPGVGTPGVGTPQAVKQVKELPAIAYTVKKQKTVKKTEVAAVKEPVFNVDYENEDVVFILKDLAKRANKNIVTDSSVVGTITVSLKNVTLDRALQVILKTSGLAYKKIDNIILVSKPENLNKISAASIKSGFGTDKITVIPVVYSQADVIKKSLQNIIPDLEVTIDKRLNSLVISAPEAVAKQAKQIVEQLDQLPSISSDPNTITSIIKVKYGKAKDILPMVMKWYPQVRLLADERINGFVVKEGKENLEKIQKLIATLDAPKRQVQFDVKIIDLTESGAKNLGVTWNGNVAALFNNGATPGTVLTEVNNTTNLPPTYTDLPFNNPFKRTPMTIPIAINYLISKGEAKLLATPKVLTLNGEKATISVGENYPFVYNDPRANIAQAQYINVSVKLDVTPQITPDGYVMAEIAPEVSDIGTATATSVDTITRSLKTNFIVKDGDTVILAGLYRKSFNSQKYKRPLFGDIPGVGEFFKNTNDTSSKSELIIMITTKIIEPGN